MRGKFVVSMMIMLVPALGQAQAPHAATGVVQPVVPQQQNDATLLDAALPGPQYSILLDLLHACSDRDDQVACTRLSQETVKIEQESQRLAAIGTPVVDVATPQPEQDARVKALDATKRPATAQH